MDYKELIERLNEWNENCISGLCADDVLTCDDLCGTGDCIVVQAATAITDLLARAEAAEARVRDLEKLLSAVQNMEKFYPDKTGFFVFTKKEADDITRKLVAAEARAEKAERERDGFKAKYIEAVNRACELSKIVDDHGWEE